MEALVSWKKVYKLRQFIFRPELGLLTAYLECSVKTGFRKMGFLLVEVHGRCSYLLLQFIEENFKLSLLTSTVVLQISVVSYM